MDVQKEREAFEAWVKSNGRNVERFIDSTYKSMTLDQEWVAWQAAKAQIVAVPEGFILMPKEPEKDTLIAISSVCIGDEFANLDEAKDLYKAVIEAQEPSHD